MNKISKKIIFSTLFVVCYLFIEWIYNQHLLILLSYDTINADDFRFTEMFGKSIASFGLNLIINSLFDKTKISRFLILWILGYIGLTYLFNFAVDSFPDDFRYSSYYSMIYRKDVINKVDDKEIIKFTDNKNWFEKSLVISQFVYTLKDEQWKSFESKIKEPINKKIDTLNKNKAKYFQNYSQYNNSYHKLTNGWNNYNKAQAQYNQYKWVRNSKEKFIHKIGLPPDLNYQEFIHKDAPEFEKYSNTKIFDGYKEGNVSPIYVKDIPYDMNEKMFNNYIDNQIKNITTQMAPNVVNIRANHNSFDSLAILVIPPISICLSLFSIIINILILIAKWIHIFFDNKYYSLISTLIVTVIFSLIITFINHKSTLTEEDSYWSKIKTENQTEHPFLFSIFTLGVKLEPLICFTDLEPKFIKIFTDTVYYKN